MSDEKVCETENYFYNVIVINWETDEILALSTTLSEIQNSDRTLNIDLHLIR